MESKQEQPVYKVATIDNEVFHSLHMQSLTMVPVVNSKKKDQISVLLYHSENKIEKQNTQNLVNEMNLLRDHANKKKELNEKIEIYIYCDVSGSMSDPLDNINFSKIDLVRQAVIAITQWIMVIESDNIYLNVITFNDHTNYILTNVTYKTNLQEMITTIEMSLVDGGSTNIYNVVKDMSDVLKNTKNKNNCHFFLLTDGQHCSDVPAESTANIIALAKLNHIEITVFPVGKGMGDYDPIFLKEIGTDIYFCGNSEQFKNNFGGAIYNRLATLVHNCVLTVENCIQILPFVDATVNNDDSTTITFERVIQNQYIVACFVMKNISKGTFYFNLEYDDLHGHHTFHVQFDLSKLNIDCKIYDYVMNYIQLIQDFSNELKQHKATIDRQKNVDKQMANVNEQKKNDIAFLHKEKIGKIKMEMEQTIKDDKVPFFLVDQLQGVLQEINHYLNGLQHVECTSVVALQQYCDMNMSLMRTPSSGITPTRSNSHAVELTQTMSERIYTDPTHNIHVTDLHKLLKLQQPSMPINTQPPVINFTTRSMFDVNAMNTLPSIPEDFLQPMTINTSSMFDVNVMNTLSSFSDNFLQPIPVNTSSMLDVNAMNTLSTTSTTTKVENKKELVRELTQKLADDARLCKICYNDKKPISIVFAPCRHTATCEDCALKFIHKPCPYCRGKILYMIKYILPANTNICLLCNKNGNFINNVNNPCAHATYCNQCAQQVKAKIKKNKGIVVCLCCGQQVKQVVKIYSC